MIRSVSEKTVSRVPGPTADAVLPSRPKVESSIASVFTFGLMRIAAAGVLIAALIAAEPSFALLAGMILVFSEGPRLLCRFSLRGVRLAVEPVRTHLFPGESIRMAVRCVNRKALPEDIEVRIPIRCLTSASGPTGPTDGTADIELCRTVRLFWFQEAVFSLETPPLNRGVYAAGPISLSGTDPFGLYRSTVLVPREEEILVSPRIRTIRPVAPLTRESLGDRPTAGPIDDPAYLAGVREYDPGRPSRHIHWKASARHARLLEKQFEPTARGSVLLIFDAAGFTGALAEEEFELALSATASIAFHLRRSGVSVGLASDVRTVAAQGGSAGVPLSLSPTAGPPDRILHALARAVPERASGAAALRQEMPRLAQASACICVCRLPADAERLAGALSVRKHAGGFTAYVCRNGRGTSLPGGSIRPLQELFVEGDIGA